MLQLVVWIGKSQSARLQEYQGLSVVTLDYKLKHSGHSLAKYIVTSATVPCLHLAALCYNRSAKAAPCGLDNLQLTSVFQKREVRKPRMVMLKRISEATSQSNIKEDLPASEVHRSHQSHCIFGVPRFPNTFSPVKASLAACRL
jgi:hypothetical protein